MVSHTRAVPDPPSSDRQYNLDLLKATAIIAMVFCHPVLRLAMYRSGYKTDFPYYFGVVILGYYLVVAHGFMFAMGTGMIYSHRKAHSDLIRRGIKLILAGYVLNFFRYGIYLLGYGLITGEFLDTTIMGFIEPDILQFAGLALIATGLFRRLGLSEVHMLAVGLILSVIGYVLPARSTGSLVTDFLLGHVLYTTEITTCFPFCYWYVFVAAGLLFGVKLRRTEQKSLFYKRILVIAGVIAAGYIALTIVFGEFFLSPNRNYYTAGTLDAAGLLSIDLFLLSFDSVFAFSDSNHALTSQIDCMPQVLASLAFFGLALQTYSPLPHAAVRGAIRQIYR